MGWFRLLWRFAIEGLRGQRGRSLLTMLGMGIGTASVVAVVSIGLVGRGYVISLIEGVGSNLVFAFGTGIGVNPEEVSFEDVDLIREGVPGIAAMAPVLDDLETVPIDGQPRAVNVLGSTASYAQVRNLIIMQGRFFTPMEDVNAAKVCVISKELAKELFGGRPIDEEWLRLFDLRFRIIGVFREGVESAAALEMSEAAGLTAVMPFSTLKNLGNVTDVDTVYIQATSPETVPGVVQGVRDILTAQHHSIDHFTIQSLDRYLTVVEQISDGITLGLMAIAGVSLLVAGIGIMNIMLVTVTERTRDIGIRLALGAGRRDILLQFLMEAGMLSLAGGLLGVAIGAGVPVYVGFLYDFDVPVSAASVVVAFGVSMAVGVFFGLYPARKAANMNIVDSLSYE
ncbi:MAG: ABC transporter permease [Deltaproteobacteria bacterium]|nr:ABC transporter permease [Deltaproteobacteria bacterium]